MAVSSDLARDYMLRFLRENPAATEEDVLDAALAIEPLFDFACEYLGSCEITPLEEVVNDSEEPLRKMRNRSPPKAEFFFCTTTTEVDVDGVSVQNVYRLLQEAVSQRKGCVGVCTTTDGCGTHGMLVSLVFGKNDGMHGMLGVGQYWTYTK